MMKHDIDTLAKLKIDRKEAPAASKSRKRPSIFRDMIVFVLGVVAGGAGLIYANGRIDLESTFLQPTAGASKTQAQLQQETTETVEKVPDVPVTPPPTQTLVPAAPKAVLEATGYVRAQRRIHVAPQIGGLVDEVFFDIGERVEQGGVLASLDDAYAQIALDKAELQLEREKAVLSEIRLSLALAESQLERDIALANKGLITLRKFQERESEVAVLITRIAAQQQEVKLADAELRLKALDLKEHLVRAAFSGVIVERFVSPGDYVSPASSTSQSGSSQGLATLVDTSSIDAVVDVSEKHVSQIQPGQSVVVSGNGADIPDMPGHVSKIIPMVDRGRATVKILITLNEYDAHFLADMGIRVRFFSSTNTPSQGG